jgi:hypothetical protein
MVLVVVGFGIFGLPTGEDSARLNAGDSGHSARLAALQILPFIPTSFGRRVRPVFCPFLF